MKKFLAGVVILAAAVCAVFFGMKYIGVSVKEEAAIADILPQDVAFYYSAQNIGTIWRNVKESNFWRELSGLKIWNSLQVTQGIKDIKDKFKDNMGISLNEENFLKLAGKDLTVAVIPAQKEASPPKILILASARDKDSLAKLLSPVMKKVKENAPGRQEEIAYNGKTITHLKAQSADQPDIYLNALGNILIIGIGDTLGSIKNIIDISSGAAKDALSATEGYKKINRLIGDKKELASVFYIDFSKMRKYFKNLKLPGAEGRSEQAAAAGIDSLDYIGGWTEIKDGLITKLYIYPNVNALTPEMKKMWESGPSVPETLKFVPEKTMLYIASTSIDLPGIWDMWQKNLKAQAPEQAQAVLETVSAFSKKLGIDIEKDALALTGNEAAFIFSDLNTEGFVPIPKIALAIKVKDKAKTDKLFADLIEKNNTEADAEAARIAKISESAKSESPAKTPEEAKANVPHPSRIRLNLKDDAYEGHSLKILQLPVVGAGIAPGYTYLNSYLVLALTQKALTEIIDVFDGRADSIRQDKSYHNISSILPEKKNQVSYINTERLMDIGAGICGWVVSFQQMTIPQGPPPKDPKELEQFKKRKAAAETTISTINDNVIPLLKTLKALKLITTASVNKKDHIEQTMVLRVKDL